MTGQNPFLSHSAAGKTTTTALVSAHVQMLREREQEVENWIREIEAASMRMERLHTIFGWTIAIGTPASVALAWSQGLGAVGSALATTIVAIASSLASLINPGRALALQSLCKTRCRLIQRKISDAKISQPYSDAATMGRLIAEIDAMIGEAEKLKQAMHEGILRIDWERRAAALYVCGSAILDWANHVWRALVRMGEQPAVLLRAVDSLTASSRSWVKVIGDPRGSACRP